MKTTKSENIISLIHNYCDRWCERCPFTSRCAVGLIDKERQYSDPENANFWKSMIESFQENVKMIKDLAQKNGVDLNAPIPQEYIDKTKAEEKYAESEYAYKESKKYYVIVDKWFEDNKSIFEQKDEELRSIHNMKLPGENPIKTAKELSDAIEVITFYLLFINVKINRALHGRQDEEFEETHNFPKDSDGSAKIALIAIERTISSWAILLKFFPQNEDDILHFLVLLERLRTNIDLEFPNARNFIRPGFDE